MIEETAVLDPRGSVRRASFDLAPRPKTLDGLRIGFLDNGKSNADVILQRLEEILTSRYNFTGVIRKPRRRPGENWRSRTIGVKDAIIDELASDCDVVVNGVGD